VVVTDVTRRAAVEHLRDEALRAFGQVDVWINNAGRGISRPVLDVTDEDFDLMMAVNTKSALYGMQAILPHFKTARRGSPDQRLLHPGAHPVCWTARGLLRGQSRAQQPDYQPALGPARRLPEHPRFAGHASLGHHRFLPATRCTVRRSRRAGEEE